MNDLSSICAYLTLPIRYCEILRRDAPDSQFEQSRDAFKRAMQRAKMPSTKTESLEAFRQAPVLLTSHRGSNSQTKEQFSHEAFTTEGCIENLSSESVVFRFYPQLNLSYPDSQVTRSESAVRSYTHSSTASNPVVHTICDQTNLHSEKLRIRASGARTTVAKIHIPKLQTEQNNDVINDWQLDFELDDGHQLVLSVKQPKSGRWQVSVASTYSESDNGNIHDTLSAALSSVGADLLVLEEGSDLLSNPVSANSECFQNVHR